MAGEKASGRNAKGTGLGIRTFASETKSATCKSQDSKPSHALHALTGENACLVYLREILEQLHELRQ